jgi:DNA-directed RNA polymerase subunit omega
MIYPPIEDLLEVTGSKFSLVVLSSRRGRQINSYFNQLGEGLGAIIPPQVTSIARKPLTIALEEIAQGKVVPEKDDDEEQEIPVVAVDSDEVELSEVIDTQTEEDPAAE